jgi:hypothetical protein
MLSITAECAPPLALHRLLAPKSSFLPIPDRACLLVADVSDWGEVTADLDVARRPDEIVPQTSTASLSVRRYLAAQEMVRNGYESMLACDDRESTSPLLDQR